jgi:AcrR family transcriptional regulator
VATTTSAPPRRERLLTVAATLFADRGYHDVGIDDIGAAAGISGPGIYRHFAGKQALLEVLCDRGMTQMLDGAQSAVVGQVEPLAALEALLDLHVRFAVEEQALLVVWTRETPALSEEVRRSLRRRMKAYEDQWAAVLTPLRPDLQPAEVRAVAVLALTLLNGSAVSSLRVAPAVRARLLRQMTRSALLP